MDNKTIAESDVLSDFTGVDEGESATLAEDDESTSVASAHRTASSRDGMKTVDKWFNAIRPIIAGILRRHTVIHASTASAGLVRSTASLGSAEDAAAASTALATATAHLDQILKYGTVDGESTIQGYLAKVQARPESRLSRDGAERFSTKPYEEALINAAFAASDEVYDLDPSCPKLVCRPEGDAKACSVATETIKGQKIAIIAIRGTVDVGDWILDSNGDPTPHPKLLYGASHWHKGILRVATHMEKRVAARVIRECKEHHRLDAVLFTGHSLGGAIAQVFYAACSTPGMAMYDAVQGLPAVHCITFGAPPVSTPPFKELTHRGMFLAIINEGDLVALAQEAYIKALVSVYALPSAKPREILGESIVPKPVLRVCGNCLVLVDKNPDDAEEPERSVLALQVDAEVVETRLFGDPWAHLKQEYAEMLAAWCRPGGDEKKVDGLRDELT